MLGIDAWLSRVPKVWCDETVARTWGRLSAETRRAGRPRPVNDMWNAACCIAAGPPRTTAEPADVGRADRSWTITRGTACGVTARGGHRGRACILTSAYVDPSRGMTT
jgi:hypothetical protein